jgi:hypothetical protein
LPCLASNKTKNKRDDDDDDNDDNDDGDENLLRRSPASQHKRLSFCFIYFSADSSSKHHTLSPTAS